MILSPFSLSRTCMEHHCPLVLFSLAEWLPLALLSPLSCKELSHLTSRELRKSSVWGTYGDSDPSRSLCSNGCLSLTIRCKGTTPLAVVPWSVAEAMTASDETAMFRCLLHSCFPSGDILATQDLLPQEPVPWVTFWLSEDDTQPIDGWLGLESSPEPAPPFVSILSCLVL